MYTIKEVLVRLKQEWQAIDYSAATVANLLKTYDAVLVNLTPQNSTAVYQYSLKDFVHVYNVATNVLLSTYFTGYTGAMPTAIAPLKTMTNSKRVRYHDIWEFGLQADRGVLSSGVVSANPNYAPDIIISKPAAYPNSLASLHNNLLYVVNGTVFFDTLHADKTYLVNATATLDRGDAQHISVLDFSELGGFQKIDITNHNTEIFSSSPTSAVLLVTLPTSMAGLTPLLIKNGNLHVLDTSYTVISDTIVAIRLNYSAMVGELIHTPTNEVNWVQPTNVLGSGYNLATINPLLYLTSGNSALIFLATNELSIHKEYLLRTDFIGKYTSATIPNGILYLEDGTLGDYTVSSKTSYGYEVSTTLPKITNALKDTSPANLLTGINNATGHFISDNSMAQMLDLYIL